MKDGLKKETPIDDASKVDEPGEQTANDSRVSRRRALITGLAAAPVIMSLMNHSVFAAACQSAHQSLLAGTSLRHPDTTQGQWCGTEGPL